MDRANPKRLGRTLLGAGEFQSIADGIGSTRGRPLIISATVDLQIDLREAVEVGGTGSLEGFLRSPRRLAPMALRQLNQQKWKPSVE
jgi:hypothetical protein